MLPFDFSAGGALIQQRLARLWEHPLKGGSWADVASNVLLFVPWGLLLAIWLAGRNASYGAALALAVTSGALLSGSVELVQLFAPGRTPSFVDLVTNTFGSSLGAVFGWPWAKWQWPMLSIRIRQLLASRPLTGCAAATAVLMLIAGLAPFELSLRPSSLKAALKAARPIPFGPPLVGPATPPASWTWAYELLTWTLAGGLCALAVREWYGRGLHSLVWSIALVGGLSLAIEAAHLAVPARAFDMTSVVLAVLGSGLGATAVNRRSGVEPQRWIVPALSIWGLAVALAAWNPPEFAWPQPPLWRAERVVPFWSYFDSRSLADLADVVGQAIIFVPLGALLAARSWRQSLPGAILVGLGIGFVLEIGQLFVPRTVDISDAISAGAGAGLGWALWRWGVWARTSSMGVARYRVGPRVGLRR
jgi:glycopeptide antibiotics resistance protein